MNGFSNKYYFLFIMASMLTMPAKLVAEIDYPEPCIQENEEHIGCLKALLEKIPHYWQALPDPAIPSSGKKPAEVLESASDKTLEKSLDLIEKLTRLVPDQRQVLLDQLVADGSVSELDLWLPGLLIELKRVQKPDEAAVLAETWLLWSAKSGRRDLLFSAASTSLQLLQDVTDPEFVLSLLEPWLRLPPTLGSEWNQAQLIRRHGRVLFSLGDEERALLYFAKSRSLYEKSRHWLGAGNTWKDEGDIRLKLGDSAAAIEAYQKACSLFRRADHELGQGNCRAGKGDAFFILRLYDESLQAYGEAYEFFNKINDRFGMGRSRHGQGDAYLALRDFKDAVAGYRDARHLYPDIERYQDRLGDAWKGEGAALFRLGSNADSLDAYRMARSFLEAVEEYTGLGYAWIGEGDVLLRLGHVEEAVDAYTKALGPFEKLNDRSGLGNAWMGMGDTILRRGDYDTALNAYRTACRYFEDSGDVGGQGDSWRGQGGVFHYKRNLVKALNAYDKATKYLKATRHHVGLGRALQGKGNVLFDLGKIDDALQYYEQAQGYFQKEDSKAGEASVFLDLGDLLYRSGDVIRALGMYRDAAAIFRSIGDPSGQASAYRQEGQLLSFLGDFRSSLDRFRTSRALFGGAGNSLGEGNTWRDEGETLLALYDFEGARISFRNAARLFKKLKSGLGLGNSIYGEAETLLAMGRHDDALNLFRQARMLFAQANNPIGVGNSWESEGNIHHRRKRYAEAMAAYGNGEDSLSHANDVLGLANIYRTRAATLMRLGRPRKALRQAAKASRIFEEMEATGAIISSLTAQAQASNHLGRSKHALAFSKRAIAIYEASWRSTRITDYQRTNLDEHLRLAYEIQIGIHADQGDWEEALILSEQSRSRVLLDLLTRGPLPEDSPIPLPQADPMDADEIVSFVVERLRSPVMIFHTSINNTLIFLVRPDEPVFLATVSDLTVNDLSQLTFALRYCLANKFCEEMARKVGQELWYLLISPFMKYIPPGETLVLVPHGPLHQLPFEALLDSHGTPLFEYWPTVVAPSISTLRASLDRQRDFPESDRFVAFSSGTNLWFSDQEIVEVARFFESETDSIVVPSTESTVDRYLELAPEASQIFITTRGVHVQNSRTESFLEFRGSEKHDSRLSAAEIAGIPLKAELVTLAACDSALGEALLSDERLDLTRSFLIAGAASVLGSRWKVQEDYRTSRFLVDFYRAYRSNDDGTEGRRADEALRVARQKSLMRGDPAQLWAAWVLVGAPSRKGSRNVSRTK